MENVGKIALADITLVEDPNEDDGRHTDDEGEWANCWADMQGAILKGRPHREGEGGSGKVDEVKEVAWINSINTFLNAD